MTNKQYIGFFILIVAIFGVLFYWYSWRPTQIKKNCFDIAVSIGGVNFDKNYRACLLDNGL